MAREKISRPETGEYKGNPVLSIPVGDGYPFTFGLMKAKAIIEHIEDTLEHTCSKGWTERCARSKGKKCRCSCGGHNHGTNQVLADETYNYEGYHRWPSQCGLKVYLPHQEGEKVVVILSELNDNPGTSITNAIENLATAIYREKLLGYPPERVLFIEHYPERIFSPASYDLVSLQWTGRNFVTPIWTHLQAKTHEEAVELYRLSKEVGTDVEKEKPQDLSGLREGTSER